jgi:hypothetical protein
LQAVLLFDHYFAAVSLFFVEAAEVLSPASSQLFSLLVNHFKETEGDELPNLLGLIAQTDPNCFSENSIDIFIGFLILPAQKNDPTVFDCLGRFLVISDRDHYLLFFETIPRTLVRPLS